MSDSIYTKSTLELANFFPFRLSQLSACVSDVVAQIYTGRFALSPQGWRVMAILGEQAPLSAAQICQRSQLDKMQVSRAIATLKRSGLLIQEPAPHDKRASHLRLSEQGQQVYRQIVPLALAREEYLLSALSPQEQQLLSELTERLLTQAKQLEKLG